MIAANTRKENLPPAAALSVEISDRRSQRLPASSPATSTESSTANQAKQQQKNDGAYEGIQNERDDTGAEMNADARQQPVTDESADQTDDQIANQSEAAALHNPTGQPAGNDADDQNDQETLIGQIHGLSPPNGPAGNLTNAARADNTNWLNTSMSAATFATRHADLLECQLANLSRIAHFSLRDFDDLLGDQVGDRIGPVGEIEDAKAALIGSNKTPDILGRES